MRIFLTGGTGYIGGALARRLMVEGHEVRALVRATSKVEGLQELGVSTFVGDLGDRYSMREGMSGADWVIHAAADLDFGAPEERMRKINVEGSDNVASLAFKLGVGRFLSVSSIAFFGGSPEDGTPATETTPIQQPFPSLYSVTKHSGELAVREWGKKGLRINTVYPSLVYGPPGKKSGSNFFLRQMIKGRIPAVVGGDRKVSWIHLDDLVEGMLAVMSKAQPGRDYLLAGDVTTVRSLIDRVSRLGGVRPPRLSLPVGVARVGLALSAPLFRLRGHKPPVPP
ncbi:MAG TPA: NAD-dependent epimerase/dehydratase family protein, partial [Thermoanaerobaculia bacterium]|nr:NAD-dependent epimerase/dehydratase family protein [Thermoanaerobaculia bacterium]